MKVLYLKDDILYVNEDGRIIKKEYKKEKGIVTSSLKYKHIININFKLPKTVEKEMLEIEAEKYLFTQGSLDYTKEYKIIYKFKEYEDFYNVEAFVVEIDVLKKIYEPHLKVFKYIDFISANPFVFKAFYDITSTPAQNDMFLYLSEDEAFLSCFENGEFLFVKSITKISTLARMLNLSSEETIEILRTKGLEKSLYEDEDIFQIVESFFSELFMKISHLINYSINNYRLQNINHIYFYSPFEIKGLFENYTNFWEMSGIKFRRYEIISEYDAFDYTAAMYNSKNYMKEDENFSIFIRPLPFYKSRIGQLSLFALFLVTLLGIDIVYKIFLIKSQENEILNLKKELNRKKHMNNLLKITIKKYNQKILKLNAQKEALENEIAQIDKKVNLLYEIQKRKPFCNILADITNLLAKYNLKLIQFEKNENKIKLIIKTKYENSAQIAKFLDELILMGYKNVFSKKIKNLEDSYISEVSYEE